MEPRSEADWETAVVELGKVAFLAWVRFVGAMHRACNTAGEAEEAGVKGAINLLPGSMPVIDPNDHNFQRSLVDYVRRGFINEEVAARAFRGQE